MPIRRLVLTFTFFLTAVLGGVPPAIASKGQSPNFVLHASAASSGAGQTGSPQFLLGGGTAGEASGTPAGSPTYQLEPGFPAQFRLLNSAFQLRIDRITPNTGPIGGGTFVTIEGAGFVPASVATIGGNPLTSQVVQDENTITGETPASAATGNVDVAVSNGIQSALLEDAFLYNDGLSPNLLSVSPNIGPPNRVVSIQGQHFTTTETTALKFNNTNAVALHIVDEQLALAIIPQVPPPKPGKKPIFEIEEVSASGFPATTETSRTQLSATLGSGSSGYERRVTPRRILDDIAGGGGSPSLLVVNVTMSNTNGQHTLVNGFTVNYGYIPPDVSSPTLTNLTPVHQSIINQSQPQITAMYQDIGLGVDFRTVQLRLDGNDVTPQARVTLADVSYTPPLPLTGGAHTVTVNLSDTVGNAAPEAQSTFEILPLIQNVSPADGATLTDPTPTLSAEFVQIIGGAAIDPASAVLILDSVNVTADATVTASGISYTPTNPLSGGNHSFTIDVSDLDGNAAPQASATFTLDISGFFTLTVNKDGVGAGDITSTPPGIDCGASCVALFPPGTNVTLTPSPGTNSMFWKWAGACSGAGSCDVVLNSDLTVTATFAVNPSEPPANDPMIDGQNIYLPTGDFFLINTDLVVPSRGFPFVFKRIYRSQMGLQSPFGANWDFNYNRHLVRDGAAIRLVHGVREEAIGLRRADDYAFQGASGQYRPPAWNYDFIVENGDGSYSLKQPEGWEWKFFDLDDPVKPGKLMSLRDRNGNTMTFSYDANGRLTQITDTLGRNYTLAYNANGFLQSLSDFTGRTFLYNIDANGDLISVTTPPTPDSPGGRVTQYTYASGFADPRRNHNLLTITDPKSQTFLTNTYGTDDKISSQQYGTGIYTFTYLPGPQKVEVLDRNGNQREWSYNADGTPSLKKIFTNRNVNPNDPTSFTTAYTHNGSGEVTRILYPEGNLEEFEYDTSNADVRHRGTLLRYKRLPYFGAPDPESLITTYTYDPAFQFVTTETDPKGNTTAYTYDLEGNLTQITYPTVTVGPSAPQSPVTQFTYNAFGQLLTVTHPEGNVDAYAYYASGPQTGYLSSLTRGDGAEDVTTVYDYDAAGNITSVMDGRGFATSYQYDALNEITKEISPAPFSYETDYTYDANGNLVRTDYDNKDENNVFYPNDTLTTTYTYDILDNLQTATEEVDDPEAVTTSYQYDANENLTRTTLPEGNSISTVYDERDLPFRRVRGDGDPEAATVSYTYDGNGNLSSFEDGEGNTTSYEYDAFDRATSQTDPSGNTTSYEYDGNDNRTRTTVTGSPDEVSPPATRLRETEWQYDELDRMHREEVRFFDPATQTDFGDGRSTTTYQYDGNNRLTGQTDDVGQTTSYQYDGLDRTTSTTDPEANTTSYEYDGNSNLTRQTETETSQGGLPSVTTVYEYDYDAMNRRTGERVQPGDPEAQTTTYQYDSRGNVVRTTDPMGNTTSYEYDGLSRMTRKTVDLRDTGEGSGTIIDTIENQQSWDANSRLQSQTDDNGNTTSYQYDALNRLSQIDHEDGTATIYEYDGNDNVTRTVDPNGTEILDTYDANSRLVSRTVNLAPLPTLGGDTSETYGYDGLNRMVLAQDADDTVRFTYDSMSNARSETLNGEVASREFDSVGNKTKITYPDGREITRTYDGLNRIASIDDTTGITAPIIQNSYVGNGSRLEGIVYGNGLTDALVYDTYRRLRERATSSAASHFLLGYDLSNNVNQVDHYFPPLGVRFYSYDSAYRLIQADMDTPPFLAAEGAGAGSSQKRPSPRLTPAKNNSPYLKRSLLVTAEPPAAGTSTMSPATVVQRQYVLDGVGNRQSVIDDGFPTTYTMDATLPEPADFQMNQYTSIDFEGYLYDKNGNYLTDGYYEVIYDYRNRMVEVRSAGWPIEVYAYDPLGRLTAMSTFTTSATFSYDGASVIFERDVVGPANKTYVWNEDEGTMVSFYNTATAQNYFIHHNHIGSATAATNASGSVVEHYFYSPFGETTTTDGNLNNPNAESAIGNRVLYLSQLYLPENAYRYHLFPGSRPYFSLWGQFDTRDPGGTWNNARHLGNNRIFAANNPMSAMTDDNKFLRDCVAICMDRWEKSFGINFPGGLEYCRSQCNKKAGASPIRPGTMAQSTRAGCSGNKDSGAPDSFIDETSDYLSIAGFCSDAYEISSYYSPGILHSAGRGLRLFQNSVVARNLSKVKTFGHFGKDFTTASGSFIRAVRGGAPTIRKIMNVTGNVVLAGDTAMVGYNLSQGNWVDVAESAPSVYLGWRYSAPQGILCSYAWEGGWWIGRQIGGIKIYRGMTVDEVLTGYRNKFARLMKKSILTNGPGPNWTTKPLLEPLSPIEIDRPGRPGLKR